MHVLVCFWGFPRSLKYTLDSIQKHIFKILEEAQANQLCTFEIFANFNLTTKVYVNPRANENPYIFETFDLDKCPFTNITTQDQDVDVDPTFNVHEYLKHGNPWGHPQTFLNHLRSLYSLKKVYDQARSCEDVKKPNVYVFLRPDVKQLHNLSTDLITAAAANKSYIATPRFANEDNQYLNDRFAICGSHAAKVYATRLDQAQQYSLQMALHSEKFLGTLCKKEGLSIEEFDNFFFQRIRYDGSIPFLDKKYSN